MPVGAFTAVYLVLAIVWARRAGNSEFMLYIGVVIALSAGIGLLHARIRLSVASLWCMSVWGLVHMAGGLVEVPSSWPINGENHVLYSLWLIPDRLKYDQVVHAYGFGVTTWLCWQGLSAATGATRPTFGLLVLCAAGGMGFGAMNEVIEFAATLLVPETNVGGYFNTGWDLVSNLVGCTIAATIIGVTHRAEPAHADGTVEPDRMR